MKLEHLLFAAVLMVNSGATVAIAANEEANEMLRQAFGILWNAHCAAEEKFVGRFEFIPTKTNRHDEAGRVIYTTRLVWDGRCVENGPPDPSMLEHE